MPQALKSVAPRASLKGLVHFKPFERVIIQGKVRRARQWRLRQSEISTYFGPSLSLQKVYLFYGIIILF